MNVKIVIYNLIQVIVLNVYYGAYMKIHFTAINVKYASEEKERIIYIVINAILV